MKSRGNPYDLEINYNRQLYNIATVAAVPRSTAEKPLCFYDYGKEKYIQFRANRFAQKDTSLSSTIKKIHMPNFLTYLKNKKKAKTISVKFSTKQLSASHKSLEVDCSRVIPIAEILQYDLLPTNILYDEDYTFKPNKATLVKKLEDRLEPGDLRFSKASSTSTTMVVEFTSIIRKQPSGGSRGAATSKMERFVIIVNGFQPLTIITKCSILDVAAPLDPPLQPLQNMTVFEDIIK